MIRKFLTTIMLALCLAGLVSAPASAALFQGAKDQACSGAQLGDTTAPCNAEAEDSTNKLIQNIVNIISVIVGVAAVIMIIINGLRFITSSGDANGVSAAKNGIIYAIVGLVIVALAQVIVRFVLTKV